jgi:hypothetical protein
LLDFAEFETDGAKGADIDGEQHHLPGCGGGVAIIAALENAKLAKSLARRQDRGEDRRPILHDERQPHMSGEDEVKVIRLVFLDVNEVVWLDGEPRRDPHERCLGGVAQMSKLAPCWKFAAPDLHRDQPHAPP